MAMTRLAVARVTELRPLAEHVRAALLWWMFGSSTCCTYFYIYIWRMLKIGQTWKSDDVSPPVALRLLLPTVDLPDALVVSLSSSSWDETTSILRQFQPSRLKCPLVIRTSIEHNCKLVWLDWRTCTKSFKLVILPTRLSNGHFPNDFCHRFVQQRIHGNFFLTKPSSIMTIENELRYRGSTHIVIWNLKCI